jgi:two-component system, OmpR family, sensor kinase
MIRNLIDNALRAPPPGGSTDVGVHRLDEAAMLQIEDSGPGIASGDMTRIFEPFVRGSRAGGEEAGLAYRS